MHAQNIHIRVPPPPLGDAAFFSPGGASNTRRYLSLSHTFWDEPIFFLFRIRDRATLNACTPGFLHDRGEHLPRNCCYY